MTKQRDSTEKMKEPYVLAKRYDWQGFGNFFHEHKDLLDKHIDLHQSTPLHYAAHCGSPSMYKGMLDMLGSGGSQHVLRMQDDMGNTPLHEVAFVGEVEMTATILKYEVKETEEERERRQIEPLLHMRNHLGETPVYRAAALGKTPLLKYFVEDLKIDLREHFHRTGDNMSILHTAVIDQFFGISITLFDLYTLFCNSCACMDHPFFGMQ